jgi:hypothetical protein
MREQAKADEKARARQEVATYENYLAMLVSLHKESSQSVPWQAFASEACPAEPSRGNARERAALLERDSYVPGFFEKLFKKDVQKRAVLQAALAAAWEQDEASYRSALAAHAEEKRIWGERRRLAERIVGRDSTAYNIALEAAGAFDEVAAFGTVVTGGEARSDALLLRAEIRDREVVPREVLKLTASSKVSTSTMAAGKYWELFQDHVCSCALRLALEAFAVLPVNRVVVNICVPETSDTTGHQELRTYLAVHFTRAELGQLNLQLIDPSSSMANFGHRMKFAKTKGFTAIEPITFEDQFVTT